MSSYHAIRLSGWSMARQRLGRQAGSVFQKPAAQRQESAPVAPSANPPYIKTTMILRPDQRTRIDQLGVSIRAGTGATVSTAAIIRGLLDAINEASIDLTHCRSEADIKAVVLTALRREHG